MTRFGSEDVMDAVASLSLCRYFPADPASRAALATLLARMVPHREALTWLTDTQVNVIGEWRGAKELRGLLCSRYTPNDGIVVRCADTPELEETGMSAETRYTLREAADWDRKIAEWKRAAGELPPADESESLALIRQVTKRRTM